MKLCVEKWKQIKVFSVVYWKTSKKRPKKIKDAVIEAKPVADQLQLMAGQLDHLANHILVEANERHEYHPGK